MVKGVSKHVIVVKAPAGGLFEQAIFMLNENADSASVDAEKLLREACYAADSYVKDHCPSSPSRFSSKKLLLLFCPFLACIIIAFALRLVFF